VSNRGFNENNNEISSGFRLVSSEMNEEYIKELYNWVLTHDSTFKERYSLDQFTKRLKSDEYVKSLHEWILTRDDSFMSLEQFTKKINN
jgi:hypothetical protein